jgi:hypothetical protein
MSLKFNPFTGKFDIVNDQPVLGTMAAQDQDSVSITGGTITAELVNATLTGTITEDVFTITDGASFEIDPENGSIQLVTLGDDRTPKATNFQEGQSVLLMIDDGSAHSINWGDSTFGGSGVIWASGTPPVLSTSGYTSVVLWKVGLQVYGARVGNA